MRALTIALAVAAAAGASTGCGTPRIGTVDPSEVPSRNDDAWRVSAEPAPASPATDAPPVATDE